ncbi:MAG: saccharopine dehydrogenase NADP-binding domain-containing protein [Calditrichaeota bacterium]|nr:saccharopine dehydrogenase NADP-binding domain-containing protein [Calditrichota bacterium]
MAIKKWMLYGANGYTGKLIAREAKNRGLNPILAGRHKEAIPRLARELGLEFRVFGLETPSFILESISQADLVLHCAGPFSQTSTPMMQACLAGKTHYLDITGEIEVFEAIRKHNTIAKQRGVMLLPGVGFDVVPTDCLALNLKKYLPDADRLLLAFDARGGPSRGTALTMIEGLKTGGKVREEGMLRSVPFAYKTMEVPFVHKKLWSTTIPWGDVSTAFHTTGIPNIEVYGATRKSTIRMMKLLRPFRGLLGTRLVQKTLKQRVARSVTNPTAKERAKTKSYIWGKVLNASGESREAHLVLANGYDVTVEAALGTVEHFMANDPEPGVQTPARILGEHFIRTLPNVEMRFET